MEVYISDCCRIDKQLKIKLSLIYVPVPLQTPTTTKTAEEYTELTESGAR
jgi:hypothetical protein